MNRTHVIEAIKQAIGKENVIDSPEDLAIYARDGSIESSIPDVVALPRSLDHVVRVVKIAKQYGIPVVPRGSGTGLSGGAVTEYGGICLQFTRMRKILKVDPVTRTAIVEPGVVNSELQTAAARYGLFFAPDPSSQKACTVGGNVAENAGGPHCLYYGVTTNHILGVELVRDNGEVHWVGGVQDAPDSGLLSLLIGSEGTFAIITKIMVHLLPLPEHVATLLAGFPDIESASEAVSHTIASGIIPAALEMMDSVTVRAIEDCYHAGYPYEAGAVLLAECEGLKEQVEEEIAEVEQIMKQHGAFMVRRAKTDEERALLWAGRKGAIGALGRIKPNYYLHDGVVPRTKLPDVLKEVERIGKYFNLPVANVFHAGDGNLHPNLLFDIREKGMLDVVLEAGQHIIKAVVNVGGTLSGEHGIGIEKREFMPLIFSVDDIKAMQMVKQALDPLALMNPGKIFPTHFSETGRLPSGRIGTAAEATWW